MERALEVHQEQDTTPVILDILAHVESTPFYPRWSHILGGMHAKIKADVSEHADQCAQNEIAKH
jgi:hypothetical protein